MGFEKEDLRNHLDRKAGGIRLDPPALRDIRVRARRRQRIQRLGAGMAVLAVLAASIFGVRALVNDGEAPERIQVFDDSGGANTPPGTDNGNDGGGTNAPQIENNDDKSIPQPEVSATTSPRNGGTLTDAKAQDFRLEATSTARPTAVTTPTARPTAVTTPTARPTAVTTPTARPTPVATPTARPTPVATPTARPTPVATPTARPTPVATPTARPTPVATPTARPTVTPRHDDYDDDDDDYDDDYDGYDDDYDDDDDDDYDDDDDDYDDDYDGYDDD